jgi:AcrR family transcriptional regulator
MVRSPRPEAPARRRRGPDGASLARERLVETANRLFYREGIHTVGVDRIIEEAGVTRATFYRHFAGKEALVETYLESEDSFIRSTFAAAHELTDDPRHLLELIIDGLADDIARRHTRGCPFINAAAEFPDPGSAVRRGIDRHRAWFRAELESVAAATGADDPAAIAAELVLLRDAAMVGGYLDDWTVVGDSFVRAARRAAGLG